MIESPIISRYVGYRNGFVPQFADKEFWSAVLVNPAYISSPPQVAFNLVTSGGDNFVDDAGNQLVAQN